ncbi:MAG: alpha/beta hydrolase [Desulfobacteraceae bacterium]|nr:alpha/beta hydrolase [Desulfobacteraceae bacterium]
MKKANGDGVQIQLAEWEGRGKTILCIHGITANCRCWDVMAEALSPGHRMLAMDLRGRGHSEAPASGYSIEHHCRDILAVLDDLGVDNAVIMGHSLGAFIALAFAAEYSDRVDRLILVDGAGKLSQEQFDYVFAAIKPSLDRLGRILPSADAYIELMKSSPYIHPWSSAIEGYYLYELEEVEGGVRCNIDPAHIQMEAENVRKVEPDMFYSKIHCKVLILKATEGIISQNDLLLPEPVVDRMEKEIPNAKRFDVEGVNHYGIVFQPHFERDMEILAFLEG